MTCNEFRFVCFFSMCKTCKIFFYILDCILKRIKECCFCLIRKGKLNSEMCYSSNTNDINPMYKSIIWRKKQFAVVIQYIIQAKISRHDRYYYCIVGYTCIFRLCIGHGTIFFQRKSNNGLMLKKIKIIKKGVIICQHTSCTFIKSYWWNL